MRYYPEIRLPYICIQMVPTVNLNPYIVNPRLTSSMHNFPWGLKFWQKLYLIFAWPINRFCQRSTGVTGSWYTNWHFSRCLTNRYRLECINNWIKWTRRVWFSTSTWSFAPKVMCSNLEKDGAPLPQSHLFVTIYIDTYGSSLLHNALFLVCTSGSSNW